MDFDLLLVNFDRFLNVFFICIKTKYTQSSCRNYVMNFFFSILKDIVLLFLCKLCK